MLCTFLHIRLIYKLKNNEAKFKKIDREIVSFDPWYHQHILEGRVTHTPSVHETRHHCVACLQKCAHYLSAMFIYIYSFFSHKK